MFLEDHIHVQRLFFSLHDYTILIQNQFVPPFCFLIAKYLQKFKLEVVEYYLLGHGDFIRGQIFNVQLLDM